MYKSIAFALVAVALVGFGSAAAAAPNQVSGKVVEIAEGTIKVAVAGDKAAWVKPNTPVKFAEGTGKIIEVSADGVSPVVITIKTKLSSKLKVDEAVSFEKGRSMAGC